MGYKKDCTAWKLILSNLPSADDHLLKKFSVFRKILQQFILGHPDEILALSNIKLVGVNQLSLEEESPTENKSIR